ncbi:MAG: PaaI family thioesterase, partial [Dehalococcoidia bacterium]|nr:PaaI family thioesterase [Dehalococcoidia bacterium]
MAEAKSEHSPPGKGYAGRLDDLLQPEFYARPQSGAPGLGMRLTAREPGEVNLEWEPRDEHLIGVTSNLRGRIHGGFLATLADYAMGLAAWSVLQ